MCHCEARSAEATSAVGVAMGLLRFARNDKGKRLAMTTYFHGSLVGSRPCVFASFSGTMKVTANQSLLTGTPMGNQMQPSLSLCIN